MSKLVKFNANQILAIELRANNPNMTQKEISEKVGVVPSTIRNWFSNPSVIDAIYERFMQVAGSDLPAVISSMIREAKMGDVQAGRLVLEHFGKLEKRIRLTIDSPFEKFLKSIDTEEAEFVEVSDEAIVGFEELDATLDVQDELPERKKKRRGRPKSKTMKAIFKNEEIKEKQHKAYELRKRANKVGLSLLKAGRHSNKERKEWLNRLKTLEKVSLD